MIKYHINNETKEVGVCNAKPGNCPVSDTDLHFENKNEASLKLENILSNDYGTISSVSTFDKETMKSLRQNTTDEKYAELFDSRIHKELVSGINKEYTDNPHNVVNRVMEECVKQSVGVERAKTLIEGYNKFSEDLQNNVPIDYKYIEKLAGVVEPDNRGRYRSTPVTFVSGGSSANHNDVERLMFNLYEYGDQLSADEFTKQQLWIHGFVDGNGRTAWLVYNWKNSSLRNPVSLPRFF